MRGESVISTMAMSADVRFKHPFTYIIAGHTGSCKSTFFMRFLQNLSSLCTGQRFKGGILWCFSERTSIPTRVGRVKFEHPLSRRRAIGF